MARARKENVDYFPHDCTHGKTIFILESNYGNDGYATWYKLLEQLGNAPGHFLDMRDRSEVLHTAAHCRITPEVLIEIIGTLAELDAIDRELWAHQVLFSRGLVERVTDAWRQRLDRLPSKDKIFLTLNLSCELPVSNYPGKPRSSVQSPEEMQQREREREREKERERKDKGAATAACFDSKREWLAGRFPTVDLDFQKEKLLTKYPNPVAEPWLLILNWFELLPKESSDGRKGTAGRSAQPGAEKSGARQGPPGGAGGSAPSGGAGGIVDRSDEW